MSTLRRSQRATDAEVQAALAEVSRLRREAREAGELAGNPAVVG